MGKIESVFFLRRIVLFLGINFRKILINVYKGIRKLVFFVVGFVIVKKWNLKLVGKGEIFIEYIYGIYLGI